MLSLLFEMNDNQESLQNALSQNWGLAKNPALSMEDLKRALRSKIDSLLQDDMHALVQLMYRLDINESKFHNAMSAQNSDERVNALTDLIIERELQRVEFRNKYQNGEL